MTKEELKKRTQLFAANVFFFLRTIENSEETRVIKNQLLMAASSVASNYRAVCRGKSGADFLNKLKIVDKEADESHFWLGFIEHLKIDCHITKLNQLIYKANQLVSIFSASIRTIKNKSN